LFPSHDPEEKEKINLENYLKDLKKAKENPNLEPNAEEEINNAIIATENSILLLDTETAEEELEDELEISQEKSLQNAEIVDKMSKSVEMNNILNFPKELDSIGIINKGWQGVKRIENENGKISYEIIPRSEQYQGGGPVGGKTSPMVFQDLRSDKASRYINDNFLPYGISAVDLARHMNSNDMLVVKNAKYDANGDINWEETALNNGFSYQQINEAYLKQTPGGKTVVKAAKGIKDISLYAAGPVGWLIKKSGLDKKAETRKVKTNTKRAIIDLLISGENPAAYRLDLTGTFDVEIDGKGS
jgi:hypothetical protein